jgi:hypothetical protein
MGPQGGRPPRWLAPLLVLRSPHLHEDLQLGAEQKDQLPGVIQGVMDSLRSDAQALASLAPAQRQERMQGLRRKLLEEMQKRLAPILRPEQQQRLQEVQLQMRGLEAFVDPAVQSALKLSEEQTSKVAALAEAMRQEVQQLLAAAQGTGRPQEAMPKVAALRQSYREKLLALLTDEQKTSWQGMIGKPFQPRPGPGGPGGGRPGQAGADHEPDFDEDF